MPLSLAVHDLKVMAGNDRRALVSLDHLSLAPGHRLGISGPSGAGKSSLLYALAGMAEKVSGRVLWGETDLLSLRAGQRNRFRAQHIGMIFQDFLLFDGMSATANAAIAASFSPRSKRQAIHTRAADGLKRFGLRDPDRSVASFSGGERQRVAIARALAGAPDVLLADEPTASLDRAAADIVIEDLLAVSAEQGRSLIVVSHDPALLERMDTVLELKDGRRSIGAAA
ncbi:MAG: ATP-binding cassette domain-containing protein [Pseudomonadota bacterium]